MKDMDDDNSAGSSKDVKPLEGSSPSTGRKRDRETQSDCEAMSYESSDNDSNESTKKKRKNRFTPTKSKPELKSDKSSSDVKSVQESSMKCACSSSGDLEDESKKSEDGGLGTTASSNMDVADQGNPSTSSANSSQPTRRRYRIRTVESSDSENENEEENHSASELTGGENAEENRSSPLNDSASNASSAEEYDVEFSDRERTGRRLRNFLRGRSVSSNSSEESSEEEDSDSDVENNDQDIPNQIKEKVESINIKARPKHTFNITRELLNRQYGGLGVIGKRIPGGGQSRFGLQFSDKFYNSLHVVERLEVLHKLKHHRGCVNAVGFNESGSLLLSGSDDLKVGLWNWNKNKLISSFTTGHKTNVFQCKFFPGGDGDIVTSSRDGQVRHGILTPDGNMKSISVLAKHGSACHKLGLSEFNPSVVLSAGEGGEVKESDIRAKNSKTIAVNMNSEGRKVPLYSLHNNPVNEHQYCVSGQDKFVCVYDRRITSVITPPVLKYAADDLIARKSSSSVTCAVYSNNGDAICASYNEDDIFLFDTKLPDSSAPIKRYSGHKNSATIKGVNMFGPDSRFIMSGSDCGNIFIWDRETEAIVNCMRGDACGVVNVLEWHPHLPVLASSGLDSDVKVWLPLKTSPPDLSNITKIITSNLNKLRSRRTYLYSPFIANNMLEIFQRMRNFHGNDIEEDLNNSDEGEEDDDEDLNEVGMPCELQ